jgi:dipeptidyl aminopeptidase/acylaminoacyl peptidase
MKLNLAITILVSSFVLGCAHRTAIRAQIDTAPREDGSRLTFFIVMPPHAAKYPVVLYLHGSGCASVTESIGNVYPFVQKGVAALAVESPGVEPEDDGKHCSVEFIAKSNRQQRIRDAHAALALALPRLSGWDGRLVVVGGSEGGAIAPEIALREPGTVAVILLAAGGWPQYRDLRWLEERRLDSEGASTSAKEKALADLDATFARVRSSPDSLEMWWGHPYQYWASYLWNDPLEPLLQLNMPVFLAHGARDMNVPIESSDAIAQAFEQAHKSNLTYRRYPGLDHRWRDLSGKIHLAEVEQDIAIWTDHLALTPVEGRSSP